MQLTFPKSFQLFTTDARGIWGGEACGADPLTDALHKMKYQKKSLKIYSRVIGAFPDFAFIRLMCENSRSDFVFQFLPILMEMKEKS